jgi:D-sedoheptulose 7-phosphate isomerase
LQDRIVEIFRESARVKERFLAQNLEPLDQAIGLLAQVIRGHNKILIFGNGGSAADAQHMAAEFVNRFSIDRPPLAAIALTTDSSILTAIANDFSFDEVFEKQVRALGRENDAAIGLSTSGRSANVTGALRTAQEMGLITIGLGGPTDSPMRQYCRVFLGVEGSKTPRIQEVHELVCHSIVEMVDHVLFGSGDQGNT